MHVIDHDRDPVALEQGELPGRVGLVDVEGLYARADEIDRDVQGPGGRHGGQHVLGLEVHARAMREGHGGDIGQLFLVLAASQHDLPVTDKDCALAVGAMPARGGSCGSMPKNSTSPSHSSAISTTRGRAR